MTFFYDLNKRLSDLATKQDKQQISEAKTAKPDFLDMDKDGNRKETFKKAVQDKEMSEADYSAKKAAAGKDIGKPGKMFSKIAKSAGKEYGSKERGEKVAGAVLAKLRAKESVDEAKLQPTPELMKKIRARLEQLHDEMEPEEAYEQMADELNITTRRLDQLLQDKRFFEASTDESALQAYLGKKKYGDAGMKALQKAGRDGASKDKMAKIRAQHDKMDEADMEEGNEFSGELAKAKAAGAKEFKVDGKSYPVKEADYPGLEEGYAEMDAYLKQREKEKGTGKFDKRERTLPSGMTATTYTRKFDDEKDEPTDADGNKIVRGRGRPKGKDKGPERVTAKSYKYKAGRPAKTKEDLDTDGVMMNKPSNMSSESADPADRGEYDREGDMAKEQMHTIVSAAKELHRILRDEENLPEWVQKKITLAKEYIDTARDYMLTQHAERAEEQPIAEKAVSKKQQKFMGMVHAAQKGEMPASKEVAKVAKSMGKKDAEDFAATKHKGLPEKVKAKKKDESVEETADAPKEKKSSGGYNFGGSVYESLDRQFKQALTEGMNVSVNMSTGQDGEPTKNITISAEGDDADRLAELLKMAGLGGQESACNTCESTPCGCESLEENSPDWPTNTETSDDAFQYSGGINGPKSTGQTTVPVIASQLRRQVSMEESVQIERSLFKLFKNYKAQ